MREKTLVGVSGVYFRYIKAYTQLIQFSDFEVTIAHIPFNSSYSPQDWKVAVNVIIKKKGKGNLVKDLRI